MSLRPPLPPAPPLRPGAPHVWVLDTPSGPRGERRMRSRALVREAVGRYPQLSHSGAIQIDHEPEGRPRLPQAAGLQLSVSHSGPFTVVAVALEEIGVDVEYVPRRPAFSEAMLARVLSPSELELVRGRPEPERHRAFLRHWVAKEALLKGQGLGLHADLVSVEVAAALTDPAPTDAMLARRWSMCRLDPEPDLVGALALAGPPPAVVLLR